VNGESTDVHLVSKSLMNCCGRDRMVVGFTTIYAISAYHHSRRKLEFRSWRSVLDTTLCDKVCQ